LPEIAKQAQSVGDLIGRAIRLYRQNFLIIVQVLLLPSAGATLGKIGLQWGLIHVKETSIFLPAVICMVVGSSLSLWFLWVLTLRQVGLVKLLESEEKSFAVAYTAVKKRGWAIFFIFLLTHLMVIVNVGLFIGELIILAFAANVASVNHAFLGILGLLGFIGGCAGALYATLFTFVAFASVALTEQKFGALLKETFTLLGRDFKRGSWFAIVLSIGLGALIPPLTLPLMGLTLVDAMKPRAAAEAWLGNGQYSLFTLVVAQSWESLINMVLWPIMFFAYGLLFQDLKVRQHASDLSAELERLEYKRA
jgi:hypothetical protein